MYDIELDDPAPTLPTPVPNPEEFLEGFHASIDHENRVLAAFRIADYIDRLMNEDRFEECNRLLQLIELERLHSAVRRVILMMSIPGGNRIPEYPNFYRKAVEILAKEIGQEEAAKRLKTLHPDYKMGQSPNKNSG